METPPTETQQQQQQPPHDGGAKKRKGTGKQREAPKRPKKYAKAYEVSFTIILYNLCEILCLYMKFLRDEHAP